MSVPAMVIVGAGACGTHAAFALREGGWTGKIVLIGEEAGLPYERPPLSKPDAAGTVRRALCDAARLDAARIDYRPATRVAAIDRPRRGLRLADGSTIAYTRLLLATGARPRTLDCEGGARAQVLRSHADAVALFEPAQPVRSAVLVGAGLIGLELAATLRHRGLAVTVVEAGPRALARAVPTPLADRLVARHRAEGVALRLGTGVARIDEHGVTLTDGTTLAADQVVAAIGVVPETALAEAAGLATGNGIVVDGRLTTSDPDILAAGDCACAPSARQPGLQRLESWRNAHDQGQHAAAVMLGATTVFDAVPWFWSDQYDLGLQVAGWPDLARPMLRRVVADDAELLFQCDDEGRLRCASALGPGTTLARDMRLAERLIRSGARPGAAALQDPAVSLKGWL
jgi:3-phenylpropionate/trans-cinnamate dioxygenase ferredoxin reductase subunit